MNFLEGVNRVLRDNNILASDDDNLTSFTNSQHVTTSIKAQRAIRLEIVDLVADRFIPYERKTGTINTVSGTRVYDLPTDYSRMFGKKPFMVPSDNVSDRLFQYPGGYDQLRLNHPAWDTHQERPEWWYAEHNSNSPRQVGFYPVPNSVLTLTFDYEATTMPSTETDNLPFQTDEQSEVFLAMASERFQVLSGEQPVQRMEDNPTWMSSKSALVNLLRNTNPKNKYGRKYA